MLQSGYNKSMNITLPGHAKRVEASKELAIRLATDLSSAQYSGKPVDIESLRRKYINERTGKPYSRQHIYRLLEKAKAITV